MASPYYHLCRLANRSTGILSYWLAEIIVDVSCTHVTSRKLSHVKNKIAKSSNGSVVMQYASTLSSPYHENLYGWAPVSQVDHS